MTDETQSFEYATAEDLLTPAPAPTKFATTRKSGYVEDEVDVWVNETSAWGKEAVRKHTDALNKYNELVEAHANLKVAYMELQNSGGATPVVEENFDQPAEAVAPVQDTSSASRRAREIMDAAAEEASEHVSRALERVGTIEAEAIAEGEEIRRAARAEANDILVQAETEAETLLANTKAEAQEAVELKNKSVTDRDAIFARLEMFYSSQLDQIKNIKESVGYTPSLVEADSAEVPAPTEPAVATSSADSYSAANDEYISGQPVAEETVGTSDVYYHGNPEIATPAHSEETSEITDDTVAYVAPEYETSSYVSDEDNENK